MTRPSSRAGLAAALGLVLLGGLAAAPVSAQELRGPEIGANAFTTEIVNRGIELEDRDTDAYLGRLVEGEMLSIRVGIPRLSTFRPGLRLYDPTGAERDPDVIQNRQGRVVGMRPFAIDMTGIWRVEMVGGNGTEGRYTISFRTRGRLVDRARGDRLTAADPEKVYEVQATDGALLDASFSGVRRSGSFTLASITGPQGGELMIDGEPAAAQAVARGRGIRLRRLPLTAGDGAYRITLRLDAGEADATVRGVVRVLPQRPRGRRATRLLADEPFIAPLGTVSDGQGGTVTVPLEGATGRTFSIPGSGFQPGARVFFDDTEANVIDVAPSGASVSVIVPVIPGASLVGVAVQNPDSQVHARDDYFFYVPPPTLTALTDLDGNPVSGGSSLGGMRVRLEGTNFRTGQTVDFGGGVDVIPLILSPERLEITTPASTTTGPVAVRLQNIPLGHEAILPLPFEFKPPPSIPAVGAYDPALLRDQTVTIIRLNGDDFDAGDTVLVDGLAVPHSVLSPNRITLSVPALPAGDHELQVVDKFGSVGIGPPLEVKGPGAIDSVLASEGPAIGQTGVPLEGGTRIQVVGSGLHPSDTATLGGVSLTREESSVTGFNFVVPAGAAMGPVDLVVTDVFGRVTTVSDALRYVGYSDVTADRSPGGDATDDLSARRGAVGDLDADGSADDLLIASYNSSPGTRAEYTRTLIGSGGSLTDTTADDFPAYGTDGSGADNWNAAGVAIGDVDGGSGADVLVGGVAPDYINYGDVRLFVNDGSGGFTLDEASAPPTRYLPAVYATDELGYTHLVYSPVYPVGLPSAIELGDLDDDGDLDLVVGRTSYDYGGVYIDPAYVSFSGDTPYITSANAAAYYYYPAEFRYYSALLVFDNDDIAGGGAFTDVTETVVPPVGSYLTNNTLPGFHTTDLSLGDIDGDDDLDIVLTWDDPTTVSVYGLYAGSGYDTPRVATRVLTNDGSGVFTDDTGTWLGSGSTPEFFQADRCELADLDGDGDLDLLLLHAQGTDAFQGTPQFLRHALRILRNDSPTTAFTDVTLSSLPLLPSDRNDNLRGIALAVRDVDGDGNLDILVGTTEALIDDSGNALRRTRLLLGDGQLNFRDATAFLPRASADTLEADDLVLGDLGGAEDDPLLILLSETTPAVRSDGEELRVLRWHR